MRALVTGGLGFVGRHLARAPAATTATRSIVLDRHGDRRGRHHRRPTPWPTAIAAAAPDAVYHLAGWADVGGSWKRPGRRLPGQRRGHAHVLLACVDGRVDRVLAVASADVYGVVTEADLPLTEDSPAPPHQPVRAPARSPPTSSALQAFLGHGLGVVRVRPFNHLGPGPDRPLRGPRHRRPHRPGNERDGGDTIPVGNLSARRDFTDVRDVVRAYRLLVEHGAPGEVYNVCTGRDLAVQELADHLVGAWPRRPIELVTDPALLRPVDLPVLRGDATEAPRRHRLGAGDPDRADARRPARRHARRGSAAPEQDCGAAQPVARPGRAASRWRGSCATRVERRPARSAHPSRSDAVAGAREQREVAVEQPALELHLGVASHDQRQPVGLGRRVASCRPPARGAPSRTRRPAGRPCAPPRAQVALEVGERHPGDGDAVGQLLLGPARARPGAWRCAVPRDSTLPT